MGKVKYTPAQADAIETRGQDLLISASAGSGKTSVLVERVIKEIAEDGLNVDQLLVITFTRLAASEMKQRIKKRLQDRVRELPKTDPKADFLRQQLAQLDTALISTIDSFCLDVIRRFYFVIDLDPDFSILTDSTQIELLKERAISDVESAYLESPDPAKKAAFEEFYDAFTGDSNANFPRDILLSLYNFAMAKPDYQKWLRELPKAYQVPSSDLADSNLWQEKIKPYLLEEVKTVISKLVHFISEADFEHEKFAKYQAQFLNCQNNLANFQEALEIDAPFDQQRDLLKASLIREKKPAKNKSIPEFIDESKEVQETINDFVTKAFTSFYASSNEEQKALMAKGEKISQTIAELEQAFIDRFRELKRGERMLDFTDMEQYAYDILNQDTSNGALAREYYQNRFKEIMVDEYQDTNALQDGLIARLKKSGENNLFMVGDVKQSIYGFRQAEPSLFIAKYRQYGADDSGTKKRIVFPENFRSSQPVTSAVNLIFNSILTADFGGIDYEAEGQLKFAAAYDPKMDLATGTEVIYQEKEKKGKQGYNSAADSDNGQDGDDSALDAGEISMIIARIQQLVKSGYQIFDPKTGDKRPVGYGDIAILTRSKTNNLEIKQEFDKYQIPLFVSDVPNYFQTFELTVIMSFLKIIDNPDQDIPLVAVLRSPIFNFTTTDLAKIRLVNKSISFYAALRTYSKIDDELGQRCREFLAMLQEFRDFAVNHRISELLWTIYEKTSFLEIVTAMPNGRQRRLNLTALYERASAYESAGFKDLYQFINFIARMRKNQKDLAQPVLSDNAEGSVNLMTIHASKGLEFPIVFLAGIGRQYNFKQDISGSYLLDSAGLGLAFAYPDDEPEYQADTLCKAWLKIEKKQKLLEEEARLLYVALTRAKQKLIMVMEIVPGKEGLEGLEQKWLGSLDRQKMTLMDKMKVNKPLDFLAPSLYQAKSLQKLSDKTIDDLTAGKEDPLLFVKFDSKNDSPVLPEAKEAQSENTELTTEEQQVLDSTERLFAFSDQQYPYLDASQTTAYQSVSEIKKAFADPIETELEDSHVTELRSANRYMQPIDTEPDFLNQNTGNAAEIGTASHLILQYYDYQAGTDLANLETGMDHLIKKGRLSKEIASQVDQEALQWFVTSDFAQQFRENPGNLYREENFASIIEPGTLFNDFSDFSGKILVHGTIDGYYVTENGIILFDYKTDHVNPNKLDQSIADLKNKYLGQLRLYQRALEQATGQKVLKKYLILLSCQQIVEVV